MSIGKYLSLEEARRRKKLKRFSEEHPSTGDEQQFDQCLEDMAHSRPKNSEEAEQT
jgi:hypothetical protein